jgi:UDP-N-acetylmuramate dehydrogenase
MIYNPSFDTFIKIAADKHGMVILRNEPLSSYTTYKIGGPADMLVKVNNSFELEHILKLAHIHNIPTIVLGGGSNSLISDMGLQGLVIINSANTIEVLDHEDVGKDKQHSEIEEKHLKEWLDYTKSNNFTYIKPRHKQEDKAFYTFSDLDYDENGDRYPILFDSGVKLAVAVSKTIMQGYTGLQWFAGIPGSVGGALFNNIHGGTKHFSDNFLAAKVLIYKENGESEVKIVGREFFDFGYDQSILRVKQGVYVLQVLLSLYKGHVEKAKYASQEWLKRKRIQPHNSPGCMFKNIPEDTAEKLGFASTSAGYIIDKQLGLAGKQIGGIQISPNHANFFVNTGDGKAEDVVQMVKEIQELCREKWGLELEPEISFLGFNS